MPNDDRARHGPSRVRECLGRIPASRREATGCLGNSPVPLRRRKGRATQHAVQHEASRDRGDGRSYSRPTRRWRARSRGPGSRGSNCVPDGSRKAAPTLLVRDEILQLASAGTISDFRQPGGVAAAALQAAVGVLRIQPRQPTLLRRLQSRHQILSGVFPPRRLRVQAGRKFLWLTKTTLDARP